MHDEGVSALSLCAAQQGHVGISCLADVSANPRAAKAGQGQHTGMSVVTVAMQDLMARLNLMSPSTSAETPTTPIHAPLSFR